MELTIVKNNKFETIGFEVKAESGNTIFSHGIAPQTSNFTLSVNGNEYEEDVIRLIGARHEMKMAQDGALNTYDACVNAGIKIEHNEDGSVTIPNEWFEEQFKQATRRYESLLNRLIEKILNK